MINEIIRSPRALASVANSQLMSPVQSPIQNSNANAQAANRNGNRHGHGFVDVIDLDAPANSNANSNADALSNHADGTLYNNRLQPQPRNNPVRERNAAYFDDFQDAIFNFTLRITAMPESQTVPRFLDLQNSRDAPEFA